MQAWPLLSGRAGVLLSCSIDESDGPVQARPHPAPPRNQRILRQPVSTLEADRQEMLHCSAIGSNSCTERVHLRKAGPDIAGKLTVAIAVDLVLATRPNASTGIERYAINLFKAMREHAPDTVAFVDRRSTVLDGPNVIAVDGGFRGWLALPRSRAFRDVDCDALVCPAFPPSPLALLGKAPVFRIIHDDFPWTRGEAMNLRGRFLFKHCEAAMARRYGDVMAPTTLMADSLSAILHRPVGTIGNAPGIDLSLAPAPDRGQAQIIAVGTIEPRKNYDAVLDLAEALPAPWRVQIVGRRGWGPIAETWDSRLARHEARVEWHGHASDAALLGLYQSADCFVSMSLAEGFNMPLVEAASLGLPVVCSDIEIHRRVAPPWARFAPLSISAADLAAIVREAAATPPSAQDVARYAHAFSWGGIAQALIGRIKAARAK
ncbi:glycosyltransferase involved in cell wall biosynthesis [Novosphingobium sp. GV055]|nr:glycosyltransferase involved in cell wall biosynthesis [Novosphingobium sp. GV055]PUB02557.1 glycosyltransferase involved in cell wall biosynthesis [Novosphingobium sp. GV061]PUB19502.1 glycosyltransferase involved in cell wall biosynthesis [Novosphingobium sp. GV079]PUB40926.1 glycosyltransferase involved in cell wall biosynthesis [Novosphingobium sp. GV027]